MVALWLVRWLRGLLSGLARDKLEDSIDRHPSGPPDLDAPKFTALDEHVGQGLADAHGIGRVLTVTSTLSTTPSFSVELVRADISFKDGRRWTHLLP